MRRHIFLALAVFVFAFNLRAPAAMADEDPSTDVSSLNYYPHENRFELNTHFAFPLMDTNSVSNGSSTSTHSDTLSAAVTYGLPKGMRVGVGFSELLDLTTVQTGSNGNRTYYSANGLADPTLTYQWRFLPEGTNGLSADFDFLAAPSLGPTKATTNTQLGNNRLGGWQLAASGAVFWRSGNNELEGSASATSNLARSTEGPTAGSTSTTDAFWAESLNVYDRYHFGSAWFLEAGLTYDLPFVNHVHYTTGVTRTNNYTAVFAPLLDIGYAPSTNWLTTVRYTYRDSHDDWQNDSALDNTTHSVNEGLNFTALWQF